MEIILRSLAISPGLILIFTMSTTFSLACLLGFSDGNMKKLPVPIIISLFFILFATTTSIPTLVITSCLLIGLLSGTSLFFQMYFNHS